MSVPTPAYPAGRCWCGCDTPTPPKQLFVQGHDKAAEAALTAVRYGGSVATMLKAHGYGPEVSVTAAAVQAGHWQQCPTCGHRASPGSMRHHRNTTRHPAPTS